MEGKRRLAEALSQILEDIKDIDAFCRPSPALAKRLCTNLKAIYDELHVTCRAIGLLSLQIENVDYASIWEELQLRNGPEKRQLSKRIAQIVRRLGEDATEYPEEVEEEENSLNGSIQNSDDDESTADKHTTDESDQEDMTNWLNSVSKIDEENSEGDEDADSVDNSISADLEFVQNAMYGDESDSASDGGIGPDSKPLMFEDFFEPRRSNRKGDQNDIVKRNKMEDRTQNSNGLHQSVDIHQKSKVFNRDKNYMWDTDGPLENSTENIMKEHKSALAEDISRLEANLLGDKPWEYKGEIKAAGRPENSLLEVSADVERNKKPAPVVSEEMTNTLEDLIRMKIETGSFSDVRRFHGTQSKLDSSIRIEDPLSQEKDSLGLGEVYANAFSISSRNLTTENVQEVEENEALVMYQKISSSLDSLSHFYFAPSPIVPEVTMKSLPLRETFSVTLEDPNPTSNSTADSVAPEEIYGKLSGRNASLKSKEELTSEDKKRSRSARKRKQKVTENIVNTVSDKRIKQGTISGESSSKITDFSKSSTFFAKLQDSVKDGIDKNNYSVKERLGKSTESAYSLKL